MSTVDRHGNTSAASIPLALDVAVRDGRIKPGHLVMLEAMGGGFTWGSALRPLVSSSRMLTGIAGPHRLSRLSELKSKLTVAGGGAHGGEDGNAGRSGRGRVPAAWPSRTESAAMVEMVLKEICDAIIAGETVKLSSFGSFMVRDKGLRVGRNPKTGREVPIPPRRVTVFKPSNIMKQRINDGLAERSRGGGE